MLGAFDEDGGVHEDFGDSGESFAEAVLGKEVDEFIAGGRVHLFVHRWCCFWFAPPASSLGRTPQPYWGGVPPIRLRSLLQTKIHTTITLTVIGGRVILAR